MAEARFIERSVENRGDGSRFEMFFELAKGPERDAFVLVMAPPTFTVEVDSEGDLIIRRPPDDGRECDSDESDEGAGS